MAVLDADDDSPNLLERQRFAAWATVRSKERACAGLRRTARAASAAWQNAEADLAHLREILESLEDAEVIVRPQPCVAPPAAAPHSGGVLTAA